MQQIPTKFFLGRDKTPEILSPHWDNHNCAILIFYWPRSTYYTGLPDFKQVNHSQCLRRHCLIFQQHAKSIYGDLSTATIYSPSSIFPFHFGLSISRQLRLSSLGIYRHPTPRKWHFTTYNFYSHDQPKVGLGFFLSPSQVPFCKPPRFQAETHTRLISLHCVRSWMGAKWQAPVMPTWALEDATVIVHRKNQFNNVIDPPG